MLPRIKGRRIGVVIMKNIFRLTLPVFIAGLIFVSVPSCEVGLGSSVDTEAPKLTIDYPPLGAKIMGRFLLAGSWNDDKKVSCVDVEICRKTTVDNGTSFDSVYSGRALIDSDGKWSVMLNDYDEQKYVEPDYRNYNGWLFGDGEYVAYVTARDDAGHSSDRNERGFYIDNSAPVLYLTKPTTCGSEAERRSYGQIIQLEGTFDDASGEMSRLKVDFYDKNGNKIYENDYSNFSTMGESSPLTVARYFSESSGDRDKFPELWGAYRAIMGDDGIQAFESGQDIEDVQVYFSVTAYDKARFYVDQSKTDGEGDGNETKVFWRGTSSMGTLIKGDGAVQNFSLADFAAYKNRTTDKWDSYKTQIDSVSNSARSWSTSEDSIANVTNDDSASGENVYLTFDVNPKNNPTFSAGGYEVVAADEAAADQDKYSATGYTRAYNGAPVAVTVSRGLDDRNIQTNSVTIYRIDRTLYSGTVSSAMFRGDSGKANYENGIFEVMWTWDGTVAEAFSDWGYNINSVYTHVKDDESNIDSLTKQITVSSFISGHDYMFYVDAADISGNPAVNVNPYGYGFCGTTAVLAPVILQTSGNRLNDIVRGSAFTGNGASSLSDVLYEAGTISSGQKLTSLTMTLTLTDSEDSSNTRTEVCDIDIDELTSAPDYSSDFTSNYCYTTTPDGTTPVIYRWRMTSASAASLFAPVTGEGSYDVSMILTANNGTSSTFQRTFTLDTKAPDPELSEITPASETSGGYWINPSKEFKLTGLVTDNLSTAKSCRNWIKLVALTDSSTEKTDVTYTSAETTGVNKWSFSVPAGTIAASYYGANLYVYARDSAGNIGISEPVKLKFDVTPPAGRHAMDEKISDGKKIQKDLFFRVGSANNDDITSSDPLWNDIYDTDVGGKYSENTYGNASTIKIRGNFRDDESGVRMIYYKVIHADSPLAYDLLKTKAENFLANYNKANEDGYTGYFAPLATPEQKRVFFNSDTGKIARKYIDENGDIQSPAGEYEIDASNTLPVNGKYYTIVESTFDSVLSGFSEGTNYLILVAEDNVGNAALDLVAALDGGDVDGDGDRDEDVIYYNASINVDTDSPSLNCSSHSGTEYTNGVSPITVSGGWEDTASGVSRITLKVDGREVNVENITAGGNWSAELPVSILSALTSGKTYNVNGTIADNAGNTSSATLFTLSSDTQAPAVEVKQPSASNINGKITLSGSVDYEGAEPASLELYCSPVLPSGDIQSYTKIKTISETAKIYSWSVDDIDTYELSGVRTAPPSASLYFIPVVTDTAGNSSVYSIQDGTWKYTEGVNCFKYTVDMDSDRPTVKVTNLSLSDGKYILKYGENAKIEGSVSDDDATGEKVVKIFIASSSQITGTAGVESSTSNGVITYRTGAGTDKDITVFNQATGEWTFTPADSQDGEKTVWFYIADNEDNIFYTGKTITVNATDYEYGRPYFQYKTSAATDNSQVLSYKSDSTSPSIKNILVQAYDSSKTVNGGEVQTGTDLILGGTKKRYAKFKITAYDANGIEGICLSIDCTSGNGTARSLKLASTDTYEGFSRNGEASGETTVVWTTDYIDLSDIKTGSVTGTVEVFDKSGLLGSATPLFMIDNDGPDINITSPSSSDQLTGEITFSGTSTDEGSAGTYITAWAVPDLVQAGYSDDDLAAAAGITWNQELDGESSVTVWKFKVSPETLSQYDTEEYTSQIVSGVYTLPFYVLAEDALGNRTVKRNFTFKHNPDGDRPVTEILYPDDSSYSPGTDYVTLGGAIRVTGTSFIPSNTTTVGSVYLQVIRGTKNKSEGGTYTESPAYVSALEYEGSRSYEVSDASQAASYLGLAALTFPEGDDDSSWWGIRANSTTSWNLIINKDNEMNPPENEITYIAIRACGVNAFGKVGAWSSWYYINIDDTAPSASVSLRQYDADISADADSYIDVATASASKEYTSDIYLKGDWYLTIKIHDETELESFAVKKDGAALSEGGGYYASTLITGSDGKEKTQYLFIPVDKTNSKVTYSVNVSDSQHTITNIYTLNIDNTAPEIEYVYKGSSYNAQNVLKKNTANATADSNYVYTLGGTVKEEASGFDRLVFYYVRANAVDGKTYTTEALLDPLAASDSKALLSGLTPRPVRQGSSEYYLYSKQIEGQIGRDGRIFTASDETEISGNVHIREGGLIEVGGLLRRINSISGGTVTFDTDTGYASGTAVTAYFPYAQVVDNTATESTLSTSANPFTFRNNSDDGDTMPETLTGSKSIGYTWDATIHSSNISDGPCALVVLAFDKAGNVSGEVYPVSVENSAPRLAKVFFGTDLNSSGTWTANEFEAYDVYTASASHGIQTTEVKDKQEISTVDYGRPFTVKDRLAVAAEIVGGNGSIMMVYKNDASSTDFVTAAAGVTAASDDTIAAVVSGERIGTVNYRNADVPTSLIGYVLANYQVAGVSGDNALTESNDGTGKKASFTFWDSTDEFIQGSTSQNCVLYVDDFTVDITDSVPPRVAVNPFYWESAKVNSLYGNSMNNGHIELESDLAGTQAAADYGTDPKVSGKVTFTGTAYDDHAIKELRFSLLNKNGTALAGFNSVLLAQYDPSSTASAYVANGGWSALSGNSGASLADGGSFEWTITAAADSAETVTGWYDDTCYLGQKGHKVYWTVSIDTSKIPDAAGKDISFRLVAKDLSSGSSAASDVTSAVPGKTYIDAKINHVPSYKVDVVPYIRKVTTGLSSMKKKNPTVYSRTALGHYSVRSDETVTLEGFNLNSAGDSLIALDISGLAGSGAYNVTVNGVSSLNNMNSSDACGSYEETTDSVTGDYAVYSNYYNRQPNNDNNNLLTDDVWFDVWEIHSDAAVPISGKIEQPVMKINPKTGQLGFAFVNGPLYFSMGGGSDHGETSYDYWMGSFDFFTSVGFAYDSLGHSYGVAAGGDINSAAADKFQFMTSRWGHAGRFQQGSYSGLNYIDSSRPSASSLRLESIGMTGTKNGGSTKNFDKQRIKSPSFATSVHDDVTNIYLAYYDAMNDEIRFKAGDSDHLNGIDVTITESDKYYEITSFDNGGDTTQNLFAHYDSTSTGKLADNKYVTLYASDKTTPINPGKVYKVQGSGNDGTDCWFRLEEVKLDAYKTNYNEGLKTTNQGYYPAAADLYDVTSAVGTYVRVCTISKKSLTSSFIDYDVSNGLYSYRHDTVSMLAGSTTDTGVNAGEYVSIGVVPGSTAADDVVVACWYDSTERVLRYAYNTTPMTNRNGTTDGSGWTYAANPVFSDDMENAGEYCQLAVDAKGGIHIAAYDGSSCDLVYAYLSSYDAEPQTCVVDSSGVVGSNITIDVALTESGDNGKPVPRIGYYATSCVRPKIAWLADTSSQTPAGSEDDTFTGKWECSVIPTTSNVTLQSNQYNKMNVGVWKNSAGVITSSDDSTAFTDYGKTSADNTYTNTANSYNSVSHGLVWGNGTSNAVMGYAIKVDSTTDHIETAQMK